MVSEPRRSKPARAAWLGAVEGTAVT